MKKLSLNRSMRKLIGVALMAFSLMLVYSCQKEEAAIQQEIVGLEDDGGGEATPLESGELSLRGPLRSIVFGAGVPTSVFYNFNLAVASDMDIFAQDCCIRDDVVQIYVDGCLVGVVDSRPGPWGTHPGQTVTAYGLSAGAHTIEYRNTVSGPGGSGWRVRETDSPASKTIVIEGCDTEVIDLLLGSCRHMSGMLAACAHGAKNHGQYMKCVTQTTTSWVAAGLISGKEKGAIVSCAAQSNIGK